MFVVDALVGNFDRHNGNWGFLFDEQTDRAEIAPAYDCGSCLLPQADERIMRNVLSDENEMNSLIFQFPTSAIKLNGKKINYFDFLSGGADTNCMEAIKRIAPAINIPLVSAWIREQPYISELQKDFYSKYIEARYELLIAPVLTQIYSQNERLSAEPNLSM